MSLSPRPSPSIFAYCKLSKLETGTAWEHATCTSPAFLGYIRHKCKCNTKPTKLLLFSPSWCCLLLLFSPSCHGLLAQACPTMQRILLVILIFLKQVCFYFLSSNNIHSLSENVSSAEGVYAVFAALQENPSLQELE